MICWSLVTGRCLEKSQRSREVAQMAQMDQRLREKLLPKLGDIEMCVDVAAFKEHAEKLERSDNGYSAEYGKMKAKVNGQVGYLKRVVPKTPQTTVRNRYTDIVCLGDRRVILRSCEQTYINASVIHTHSTYAFSCENCELDKEHNHSLEENFEDDYPGRYIAAQAPLENTIEDFWRMCLEKKTPVILMLTPWSEESGGMVRMKANKYFPEKLGQSEVYGDFTVKCLELDSSEEDHGIVARKFEIKGSSTSSSAGMVWHLYHVHFTAWPDFGSVQNFSLYLNLHACMARYEERKNAESDHPEDLGPLVVHCSAGIGRTGTYIAIDTIISWLWRCVKESETHKMEKAKLEISKVVANLRNQRPGMVVTEEQYVMIYQVVYFLLFGTELERAAALARSGSSTASLKDSELYRKHLQNS